MALPTINTFFVDRNKIGLYWKASPTSDIGKWNVYGTPAVTIDFPRNSRRRKSFTFNLLFNFLNQPPRSIICLQRRNSRDTSMVAVVCELFPRQRMRRSPPSVASGSRGLAADHSSVPATQRVAASTPSVSWSVWQPPPGC